MLDNDPRPASYKTETDSRRIYGTRIFDVDVKWSVDGNRMEVMGLES